MATPASPTTSDPHGFRLSPAVLLGVAALLAPLSYLAGRVSATFLAHTWLSLIASGVAASALGVMVGIPIGLFFGTMRGGVTSSARPAALGNTLEMERSILEQLRQELAENLSLFEARQGLTTMFARIDYIMPFWTSIKASGRLFVMQDAALLGAVGTAYYWLEQATHLERLAYEAKYSPAAEGGHASAERLVGEARLLDGQIASSLAGAISAIDLALSPR